MFMFINRYTLWYRLWFTLWFGLWYIFGTLCGTNRTLILYHRTYHQRMHVVNRCLVPSLWISRKCTHPAPADFLARLIACAFSPDFSTKTDTATVNSSCQPVLFAMDISACHKAMAGEGSGFSSSVS